MYLSIALILFTTLAWAQNKSVYGEDDRKEPYESSALYQELSLSTAAMIPSYFLKTIDVNLSTVTSPKIKDAYQLCPSERFLEQPSAASCSGFLIGPDLLVTAGHCVSESSCKNMKWVFGYQKSPENNEITFPTTNIYSCKKIITDLEAKKLDSALIQLDREVSGRKPLRISPTIARKGDELMMIGHPTGLPTKITDQAQVRRRNKLRFQANLDAFAGNSGSAVMNAHTGEVVGILVSGRNDYHRTSEGCVVAKRYNSRGGEWISDIFQLNLTP
jgi:V8-like Glu-specific endopeptidase